MALKKEQIAVAHGDGIGPEIMNAVLRILQASGAPLEYKEVEIGEKVYLKGCKTGIEQSTWDTLLATKAFLKAPITTPQGGGFKSLNVTIRGAFGLYANVRPCISYFPFIETKHPKMDLVIIRENEEDLYAGIEYQPTSDCRHALKVISEHGSEKIIRYAFNYAEAHGRKKVTCFTKDNILKLSDGLFHQLFEEIAKEYPTITHEHWIVDIGAAKISDTPDQFDVVVMPNLYGDIISDITAQLAGSVGLAGSANIGLHHSMFEAIHGSAPRRAGQNLANPSGLLLGAVMMLHHLHLDNEAALIQNAWLRTIEEGIHTYDIFKENTSKEKVGTKEFSQAVIDRLGKKPERLQAAAKQKHITPHPPLQHNSPKKELIGCDLFIDWRKNPSELKEAIEKNLPSEWQITLVTSRGSKVWPEEIRQASLSDCFRVRIRGKNAITSLELFQLMQKLAEKKLDITETHNLYLFDGKPGFSLSEF